MSTKNTINAIKKRLLFSRYPIVLVSCICVFALIGVFAPFIYTNITYELYGDGSISENPQNDTVTALILGAGLRNQFPSRVLQNRLNTGADLYLTGKVDKLLVSGSNDSIYYDEPTAMRKYLEDQFNIPTTDIVLDFGGIRTFDSCKRAKEVFEVQNLVIVTQRFHMHRAFYLCDQVGYDSLETKLAKDTSRGGAFNGYIREIPATWQAVIDIISGRDSKFDSDGSESVIE